LGSGFRFGGGSKVALEPSQNVVKSSVATRSSHKAATRSGLLQCALAREVGERVIGSFGVDEEAWRGAEVGARGFK